MLEAQTGVLCHDGETGDILTHNVKEGDTITILYDGMEKTLSFGFDGKVYNVCMYMYLYMYMYVHVSCMYVHVHCMYVYVCTYVHYLSRRILKLHSEMSIVLLTHSIHYLYVIDL